MRIGWRSWLVIALAASAASCSSAPGGGSGAGAGAGGGAPPAGCVDIRVGTRMLPDPSAWVGGVFLWERHAFWIDDRGGVHVGWAAYAASDGQAAVFLTTFSQTGELVAHKQYDPFPPGLGEYALVFDVAAAPDGSFAILLEYFDDAAPIKTRYLVLFSSVDAPNVWQAWPAPFSDYADGMQIAWDGESFAIHSIAAFGQEWYLTRARWTGGAVEEVTPTMQVGFTGSVYIDTSDFETDPVTGQSWATDGVVVTAHDREGNLLPGAAAQGYGTIHGGDSDYQPTIGLHDGGARVAGTADNGIVKAVSVALDASFANTSPVAKLPDLGYGAMLFLGDEANLFAHTLRKSGEVALERFRFKPDGSWTSTTIMPFPTGDWRTADLRNVSAVVWQGEPWVGLYDESEPGTAAASMYRVLRVHGACTYPTLWEIAHKTK